MGAAGGEPVTWGDSGPMRDRYHRALDEATVIRLECTSSVVALDRVAREIARGTPAYDPAPYTEPRDELAWCARETCGRPFWRQPRGGRRFCSTACQQTAVNARRRAERRAS